MCIPKRKYIFSWIAVACGVLCLTLISIQPVRSAIEIGPDEHYELMKAMLWAKGYSLYSQVWNDQPPLYTILLGFSLSHFGLNIITARAVAVCCGVLMLACFFMAVWQRSGMLAAGIATAALFTAPQVFLLSVSVMLESPAMMLALLALIALQPSCSARRWLVVSAGVLAIALQTKVTACIFVPALCAQIITRLARGSDRLRAKTVICDLLIYAACTTVFYLTLAGLFGSGYQQAWHSHFSRHSLNSAEAQRFRLHFDVLLNHCEGIMGTCAGITALVISRDWRRALVPCVLLVTVFAVHLFHRPWWSYYYLHLAIPIAWLTGYGASEVLGLMLRFRRTAECCESCAWWLGAAGAGALIGALLFEGGTRLNSETKQLYMLPRIKDSGLIAKMRQYAGRTRWIYTHSTAYAFHAGLAVPPELGVLVKKRFWSSEISEAGVRSLVERYRPEQILLSASDTTFQGIALTDVGYSLTYEGEGHSLYVANEILQ